MSVLVVHSVYDTLVYLVGCNPRLPVVRVYRLAHKKIVSAARNNHWPYLFVPRWVGIGIVWRTEKNGALPRYAFYEHARELQFGIRTAVRVFRHVVVGERMVAYGVPVVEHLLHQRQVLLHLQSHHKEGCGHFILLQRA